MKKKLTCIVILTLLTVYLSTSCVLNKQERRDLFIDQPPTTSQAGYNKLEEPSSTDALPVMDNDKQELYNELIPHYDSSLFPDVYIQGTYIGSSNPEVAISESILEFAEYYVKNPTPTDRTIVLFGNEYNLKYVRSVYNPLSNAIADEYYVKEQGKNATVQFDPNGKITKLDGFTFLNLDVGKDYGPEILGKALLASFSELEDLEKYETVKYQGLGQARDGQYNAYDISFSSFKNGYERVYVLISVFPGGTVNGFLRLERFEETADTNFTVDSSKLFEVINAEFVRYLSERGNTFVDCELNKDFQTFLFNYRGTLYLCCPVRYSYISGSIGKEVTMIARVFVRFEAVI